MEEVKEYKYKYDDDSKMVLFDSFDIYQDLRVKHRIHAEAIGTLTTNPN
jgi:hypothetical protein